MNKHLHFGPIRQLGYLVEDVTAAANTWMESQGVGPWTIIRNVPLNCIYKGEASQPLVHIGLSFLGDMQIELIQQVNDAPSPYLRYIQQGQYGLHHTAHLCEDIELSLTLAGDQGHQILCDIRMPDGGRYVYTHVPALGEHVFTEFLSATDRMKQMFQQGQAAAEAWDGTQKMHVIEMQ